MGAAAAHPPPTAPLDIFFTMAVPEGAPKDPSDTSDRLHESNNAANNSDDNGGRQMTLSSDEVNYLIFREVLPSP